MYNNFLCSVKEIIKHKLSTSFGSNKGETNQLSLQTEACMDKWVGTVAIIKEEARLWIASGAAKLVAYLPEGTCSVQFDP